MTRLLYSSPTDTGWSNSTRPLNSSKVVIIKFHAPLFFFRDTRLRVLDAVIHITPCRSSLIAQTSTLPWFTGKVTLLSFPFAGSYISRPEAVASHIRPRESQYI